MRRLLLAAGAAVLAVGAAHASTVIDPTGDFLASFTGPHDPDLDVTSFSASFDPTGHQFLLGATFAGAIDPTKAGLYVIGIDTGTGAIAPFGSIGEPNVIFNQAILVQKTGAATLGANSLTATIAGNSFSLAVPQALLPSTGFGPGGYLFNLWPRTSLVGGLGTISDFAPQNALLGVPEPGTWAMIIGGFAMVGATLRRRRGRAAVTA